MDRNHTHTAAAHYDPSRWGHIYGLLFVTTSFFVYCCCVGAWLARLWYYNGQLHKKFPKYDIQPQYIRERLAIEAENKRSESQRVMDTARWNRDVTTMSFERVQEFDSSSLRERIFENRRISRLPAFEQDDGGDGSEFPEMPVDMTAEDYNEQHFPEHYDDYRDLGLSELGWDDWLTFHNEEQMTARSRILDNEKYRKECIRMHLGRQTEDICGELWQEFAYFLCKKYPSRFWEQRENGRRKLWDEEALESYELEGPFGWLTLDTMARLVREDFCIFLKSPFSGQYMLMAGATCFPSGWRFGAHVGHSVDKQQEEVLPWEKLAEILSYMDEHVDSPPYKRHVAFIQTLDPYESDLGKKYFIQEGKDFFSGNLSFLQPQSLNGRIERQMFRRLSKSGAIVLTTRVQVESLVRMDRKKLQHLAKDIRSWPAHAARLKGRGLWGRAVLGYIEEFPMARDDDTVVNAGELTDGEISD